VPQRAGRLRVEPVDRRLGSFRDDPVTGECSGEAEPSVLDHVVDAIGAAAAIVSTAPPHRPWIDALPDVVHPRDLDDDPSGTGLLDDPASQCRRPLRWTPHDGNLLLVGAVGAGTTTACIAVVAAGARASPPEALHIYVIDAQGESAWSAFEPLAHCGAVVRVSELERLTRLLARLAGELDRRATDGRREPSLVIAIDGFAAVRDALDDVAHVEAATRLDRVLRDGPALGIVAVVTTDGSSSRGLAVPRSATWVFHVVDDGVARTAGLRGPVVGPGRPGRFRVVESGLEGHVVHDPDPLRDLAASGDGATGPPPVSALPEVVDADSFDTQVGSAGASPGNGLPVELPIGISADDLEPTRLVVPSGDHVFIGGGARTGRSTALRQVEVAWRRAHPTARIIHLDRHHGVEAALTDRRPDATPLLVVVDDAERVDDHGGVLARLVAQPGVTFAVAARLEAVRVAYGHWTRDVARGRCGLIMTSMGDIDGELLGATLPRRSPMPPRPGLAWVVDQAGSRLVQVADRMHT
jgi:S-DNA-T family DNA segregation ATPase FtsK/SpoIIIE